MFKFLKIGPRIILTCSSLLYVTTSITSERFYLSICYKLIHIYDYDPLCIEIIVLFYNVKLKKKNFNQFTYSLITIAFWEKWNENDEISMTINIVFCFHILYFFFTTKQMLVTGDVDCLFFDYTVSLKILRKPPSMILGF